MKAILIINRSLRLIEVLGQAETATAAEAEDCLVALNQLMASWSINANAIYAQDEIIFPVIASKYNYTIGIDPLADIQAERPDKILRAYSVVNGVVNGYTTELGIIENPYYQLLDKTLTGIPSYLYYNPTFPLGNIYLSPIPSGIRDVKLSVFHKIKELKNIDDEIDAPQSYLRALAYNLAIEIAPEFGKEVSNAVAKSASESLLNIKRINSKTIVSQIECGDMPIISGNGV